MEVKQLRGVAGLQITLLKDEESVLCFAIAQAFDFIARIESFCLHRYTIHPLSRDR
jgi:predicted component of type VI protein secretion system